MFFILKHLKSRVQNQITKPTLSERNSKVQRLKSTPLILIYPQMLHNYTVMVKEKVPVKCHFGTLFSDIISNLLINKNGN